MRELQNVDRQIRKATEGEGDRGHQKARAPLRKVWQSLKHVVWQQVNNPIVLKELRGRMRGWRAAIVLSAHLVILGCFASLIYFTVAQSASSSGTGIGKTMGQALFYSTYVLLLVVVVFLSPAFTAGAISSERERRTLDLLITTLLPAHSIVLGKLMSALAYIVLIILAALPVQSLAFMFGGITLPEMLIGTLVLLVTALIAGSVGIFVSSLMKSSIASTVITYAVVLLVSVGVPAVVGILFGLINVVVFATVDALGWIVEIALIYTAGLLICTNPFATVIATKVIEQEQDTLFFFLTHVYSAGSPGTSIPVPLVSPWLVYVPFYVAVSALLILATILIIRRKRG